MTVQSETTLLNLRGIRPELGSEIRQAIEQAKGEPWEKFAERHGDDERDVALYVLRQDGGLSLPEAGRCVGLVNYHAAAQALKRLTARLSRDEDLRGFVDEVQKCIQA